MGKTCIIYLCHVLIITGAIQLVPAKQPAVERQCSERVHADDIGKTVLSQYVEIKVVLFSFEVLFTQLW